MVLKFPKGFTLVFTHERRPRVAAKCREMANNSPEKDKKRWLRMDQFWLSKASRSFRT